MAENVDVASPTTTGTSPAAASRRHRLLVTTGIAAVSAAVLIFEIALSRVFAVTQFYHFAFLTVSLALLGFGASGSALAAFPRLGRGGPRHWSLLALLHAATTVGAYAVVNTLPFDSFAIAWDRRQILYLAVYYVSLAVPFFFGGAVMGILLAGTDMPYPMPSHHVYAASLAGSGAGCLIALWGIDAIGAERTVVAAAFVAALGAAGFAWSGSRPATRPLRIAAIIVTVALAPFVAVMPPGLDLELSPYKGLAAAVRYPGAQVTSTEWDQGTRVDHVVSDGIRSLAGLSLTYSGPLEPQDGVTFDGDDLSPIPRLRPEEAEFAPYLMSAVAYELRPGASTLVLEPRGGLDVLVALASGASRVTAVESIGAAVAAVEQTPGGIYGDERVDVVAAEPRSFVAGTERRFDVIDLALTSPYRPVSSGAYSLAEDYSLTVEAFAGYLSRLGPGGVLTAMRWVQVPPSEAMRLIAVAAAAVRDGGGDPAAAIVGLRGYATAVVLVRPNGFSGADMATIRGFADRTRFDLVAGPGVIPAETNRYNVLPADDYATLSAALLSASDPGKVYAGYEFDIAPPTDDHPFFGHFFKWEQSADVLDELGRTWQPFGGAGYFVLLALLALAAVGAATLIVAPLLASRSLRRGTQEARGMRWWTLGYFGLLGLAFLFVEIPIIQQYILLTGNATRALAVVLFVILVSSGAGSLLSRRLPWRPGGLALTGAIVLYAFTMRSVVSGLLSAPLAVRVAVGALAVAPVGLLMGVMFPRGIEVLEHRAPGLVPWAWGINGTASVISATASALLALSFGLSFVMFVGAAAYGLSAVLARPARTGSGG